MKQKLTFLILALFTTMGAWAIDSKIADYSNVQPWGDGAIISRSNDKLTLTSTAASGVEGTTLVTSGGTWDRYGNWLLIVPGTTDEVTYTVTLNAPEDYTIVGYVIECCSWNANRTYVVTAADNTTVTATDNTIQTLNVKNLDVTSTTFTVKGESTSTANVYFTIKNMTVALVKKQGTRLNSTATGVTWNNNNDPTKWNNTWTSGTTPNITLKCGNTYTAGTLRGNMHKGDNVEGAFYLHTNNTPDYVISIAGNYMITGYTIVGTATGDFTWTPISGTADGSFKGGQTKAVHVSGVASNSVGFSVSPGGHAFTDATIYLEYEAYTPVTSVSNTKSYYITTADRGAWVVASGATQVNATSKTGTSAGQEFAFINYDDATDDSNDGTYLYSVSEGKFISKSGTYTTLTEFPGDKASVLTSENANFPTVVALNGGSSHAGISNGYNPAVITSWNSLSDAGNCCAIVEADDFDATAVLAKMEDYFHPTHTITYIVKDSEDNTLFTSSAIPAPLGTYNTLPSEYHRDYFFTYSDESVTIDGESSTNTNLVFTATPKSTAIKYTANATAPEYYNLNIRSKYLVYDDEATGDVKLQDTSEPFSNDASWAFIGNPYDGFKVINKANGTDKYLTYTSVVTGSNYNNNNISFVADGDFTNQYWYVDANTGGFCLRMKENTNIYFHHDSGNNYLRTCSVSEWSGVHNDAGSTVVASTDEDVLFTLNNYMQSVTIGTGVGQLNSTNVELTNEVAASTVASVNAIVLAKTTAAYPEAYTALLNVYNNIALVEPTAGFYRLKNVATDKYLTATALSAYNNENKYVFANGNNSDASTVIRLAESADKLYMYNQGYGFGWVDASKSSGAGLGYLTETADKYVNWFPGTAAGRIAFAICLGNGTGGYASYLKKGIYTVDTTDESVIGGTDETADAAQWVIEEATSVTVNMNSDGASNYYATFCAPFSYTVGSGTTAYTLEDMGTYLKPTAIDGEVTAGTPVLLKGTSATATLTIGTGYQNTTPLTTTALTGTYLAKTIGGKTDYVLGIDGGVVGFYHWNTNTLGANRAYYDTPDDPSSVKGFVVMFDEDADAIKTLSDSPLKGENIYNLAGQRLNKMQKGINIVNGKKILF